jgi:hypothetical protein
MASLGMRTTLNLDDDVLEVLRTHAEARSVGRGKVASDLIRRELQAPVETRMVNGFYAVVLAKQACRITSEHVQRLLVV